MPGGLWAVSHCSFCPEAIDFSCTSEKVSCLSSCELLRDAGHTCPKCLVDQNELSVPVLHTRLICNHNHTILSFQKVKQMSLSSFNLMIWTMSHHVLIKKPRTIILSFIHQQVGLEKIANVLNTIFQKSLSALSKLFTLFIYKYVYMNIKQSHEKRRKTCSQKIATATMQ